MLGWKHCAAGTCLQLLLNESYVVVWALLIQHTKITIIVLTLRFNWSYIPQLCPDVKSCNNGRSTGYRDVTGKHAESGGLPSAYIGSQSKPLIN